MAWAHYGAGEIEAAAGSGAQEGHLRRAVESGRQAGTPVSVVALVTLTAGAARDGATAVACAGYLELIDHWLRTGGWIMLWTTLRNTADLLASTDPETVLAIWEGAAGDPYAPALADDVATEAARR